MSQKKIEDIDTSVRRLVAEVLWTDEDELDVTVPLVDYGMDSLRAISLVVRLEEEFSVSLPDDTVTRLHTTEQIVRYLAEGEL